MMNEVFCSSQYLLENQAVSCLMLFHDYPGIAGALKSAALSDKEQTQLLRG
jgi:hypothetical protein